MKLKGKRRIIVYVFAALAICVLCLVAVLIRLRSKELSFRFLEGYEPERHSKVSIDRKTHEYLQYHIKVDYDTLIEAAKAELQSKGYKDVTKPGEHDFGLDYEKKAEFYEHTRVEIMYAIITDQRPIHFWIDIRINRDEYKLTVKDYWSIVKHKLTR